MKENFTFLIALTDILHFIPESITMVLILIVAIVLLLFLVLKLRMHAFLGLLVVSIITGLLGGMQPGAIISGIQQGMGSTLGYIAVIVGLGAIFGKILEFSGGAEALAQFLLARFGEKNAPWSLTLAGFIIAIPVFFDVGFIILVPVLYSLSRKTGKSLLLYGIPLLAGLAVTHTFIPPTPGPVAVAEILGADLGWVILFGFIVGIPVSILAGPVFGRFISRKIITLPQLTVENNSSSVDPVSSKSYPAVNLILMLIGLPLILILLNTILTTLLKSNAIQETTLSQVIIFIGHPFSSLIIATIAAMYFLGIRRGTDRKMLQDLANQSLGPAGAIILVTGAGGVLKQILIDSGIGSQLAESLASTHLNPLVLAWLIAAVIRITQGSATVAMITSAGIMSTMLEVFHLSAPQMALMVIAVASGATIASHVNDSGFWLVGKYLHLDEKQTLQSWTVMETIIAVSGLLFAWILYLLV